MEPQVVAGVVAAAAANFVGEIAGFGVENDAGSYGVAVGFGADQVDSEPMVVVLRLVYEEIWQVAEVIYDGFETAVVPEVGYGEAAAGGGTRQSGAGGFGDVGEFAVAEVAVEEARLAEGCA